MRVGSATAGDAGEPGLNVRHSELMRAPGQSGFQSNFSVRRARRRHRAGRTATGAVMGPAQQIERPGCLSPFVLARHPGPTTEPSCMDGAATLPGLGRKSPEAMVAREA